MVKISSVLLKKLKVLIDASESRPANILSRMWLYRHLKFYQQQALAAQLDKYLHISHHMWENWHIGEG